MRPLHQFWMSLVTALVLTLSIGQVFAENTVINVSLWDKGPMSMSMLNKGPGMGMRMGGTGTKMPMAPMGITVSSHTIKAGKVTLAVTNTSTVMVHEMVVSPIKNETEALPYNQAELAVDEDAIGTLGEVADLAPGKSGAITIDLKPGKYILYCNIPGHYVLGMWTLITVN